MWVAVVVLVTLKVVAWGGDGSIRGSEYVVYYVSIRGDGSIRGSEYVVY